MWLLFPSVDLAIIVLPVEMTLTTLQECADRGIKVLSSLPADSRSGRRSAALESQVLKLRESMACASLVELWG